MFVKQNRNPSSHMFPTYEKTQSHAYMENNHLFKPSSAQRLETGGHSQHSSARTQKTHTGTCEAYSFKSFFLLNPETMKV